MTDAHLTEGQQNMLKGLEQMHELVIKNFGKNYELEHIRIAKTNGNVPWKVMCAYCDNHNTDYPDWPDMVKTDWG